MKKESLAAGCQETPFWSGGNRNQTTPGLVDKGGGVAGRGPCRVLCVAQMVAGSFDQIDHEGSVGLIQLCKPCRDFGGLIVRLSGCLCQHLADTHTQAVAYLFECLQGGRGRSAFEAADGLWLDTNAFGQIGLSPFLGLAQCGDLGAEALRQWLARMLLLDHIC